MSIKNRTLAICIVLVVGLYARVGDAVQTRDVRMMSWEASPENVKILTNAASKDDLTAWLIDMHTFDVPWGTYSYWKGSKVRDFRFIDLNNDGVLELVLEVQEKTAQDTRRIDVIFRKGNDFSGQEIPGMRPYGSLNEAIRDLDADARYEIVTVDVLVSYRGGYLPQIEYPMVFGLNQNKYVREDSKYPKVYEEFVAKCNGEIQKVRNANPAFTAQELEDATIQWEIPRDKALRALGIDKKAGLAAALAWSVSQGNSVVPDRKKLAVEVLGDINDSTAADRLMLMAQDDDDWLVRELAARALFQLGGERFVRIYERLLNDPYYDAGTHQYPVRETAVSLLTHIGVQVEGKDGNYRVKK